MAFQKAVLDPAAIRVAAGHEAVVVHLARIGCDRIDRHLDTVQESAVCTLVAGPHAFSIEKVADEDSLAVDALGDAVKNPGSVLDDVGRAVRGAEEFLAKRKTAGLGKSGDRSIVADGARLRSGCVAADIEHSVVASVERSKEPVLDTAGVIEAPGHDIAVIDSDHGC